ncbi:MAG: hypothetical protein RIQ56_259 [Candidatus Parcubacteria bacterium]
MTAVLVGVFIFASRASTYHEIYSIGNSVTSFEILKERFISLAQSKGGEYAFEVLGRAPLPPGTDLHLLGHVVGDVLYEQKGIPGMAACTQGFRNACSHSIVINALFEHGEDILPQVWAACQKAPGGKGAYTMCFHGFGHGVFTYFGRDLEKTVTYCRKAGTAAYNFREYQECVGGAIMELVDPGPGIGGDEVALDKARERYFDGPLSPCMSPVIPEDAKGICFVYLTPRLWIRAGIDLGNPDPAKFADAFKLCDKVPRSKTVLRNICYGGFGKEFTVLAAARDIRSIDSQSDDFLNTVAAWCAEAGNQDGEAACVGDAVASLFWGGENDPDISFKFCGMLKGPQLACYARLAHEVGMYGGNARQALCDRIPLAARSGCEVSRSI